MQYAKGRARGAPSPLPHSLARVWCGERTAAQRYCPAASSVCSGTMAAWDSGSRRSVFACIALLICDGAQRALAQTLQCPDVGSVRYPVLPAGHSCAGFFGTANGAGTADGRGLCAILNLGLGDACGGEAAVPTDSSWWVDHLTCSESTSDCKTSDEISGASSASRHPYDLAPAFSDSCYKVCVCKSDAKVRSL